MVESMNKIRGNVHLNVHKIMVLLDLDDTKVVEESPSKNITKSTTRKMMSN